MNKKVLSAILFGALVAGTGTFTSCIDNEEPASIATLRGAKADLIKAQAEVERAKIAKIEAEADAARAEIAYKQALADAEKARAEAEKALNEVQLAEAQARLAKAQADAEKATADAEAARKKAEADYQKAIFELKQLQVTLVQSQSNAIKSYVTAYDNAIDAYNKAVDEETKAQRTVTKQLAVVADNEANKESLTRKLNREVAKAEAELKGYQDALTEAEAEYAEAQTLEVHEWANKAAEIQTKIDEIDLSAIALRVEAAETVEKLWNDGRFAELETKTQEIYDMTYTETHVRPAVEVDLKGGYFRKYTLSLPEAEVTYNDYLTGHEEIENAIEALNAGYRDENDNAWTEEALVVLKELLKQKQDAIAPAKKLWEESVAAFKTGKYNEADPSAISGYDDVVAKLEAFNTAQTAVNTAWEKVISLQTKKEDETTMNETIEAVKETYAAAELAAKRAYNKATTDEALLAEFNAGLAPLDATLTTAKTALTAATTALTNAQTAYQTVLNDNNGDTTVPAVVTAAAAVTAAQADVDAAQDDVDAAQADVDEYTATAQADILKAHQDTKDKAIQDAWKVRTDAIAAAEKTYKDLWDAETGTAAIALHAAEIDKTDKENAAHEAAEALVEVSETYNENVVAQDPINTGVVTGMLYGTYDADKGYKVRETITIGELLILDKAALVKAVNITSAQLFGTTYYANMYEGFDARLVEITAEEMEAEIEKLMEENEIVTAVDYIDACEGFGLMGEVLAYQEKVRVVEFWLNNKEWIDGKIEALEAVRDELHAAYDELTAAIDEKKAAFDEVFEKLDQDIADAFAPIDEKLAELKPLRAMYRAYQNGINELLSAGKYPTEDAINNQLTILKNGVETAKDNVYNAQDKVDLKNKNLNAWNEGALSTLEIYQNDLDAAKTAVERASAKVDTARTRLEAALAALEWTAAE